MSPIQAHKTSPPITFQMEQPLPIQQRLAFQLMMTRMLMMTENSVRLYVWQLRDTRHDRTSFTRSCWKQPESGNQQHHHKCPQHQDTSYWDCQGGTGITGLFKQHLFNILCQCCLNQIKCLCKLISTRSIFETLGGSLDSGIRTFHRDSQWKVRTPGSRPARVPGMLPGNV